jgi:K+-sensing histidine kinase KdpD
LQGIKEQKHNSNSSNGFEDTSNNQLALIIIKDITKARKYEKQKQIDKMKTIYFCSVAHDLRTPINSIMGTN